MKKIGSIFCAVMLLLAVAVGCGQQGTTKDYTAEEISNAIKAAYGDTYLPDEEIPEDMLTDTFGLDMSLVEEVKGEMPAVGFHPDRVIVVKAKEGKGAEVEAALTAARESMLNEAMWYPANMPKVNASKVVRNGDYVCFLMVGAADDENEDEAAAAEFAEQETQKAVDAFEALFREG